MGRDGRSGNTRWGGAALRRRDGARQWAINRKLEKEKFRITLCPSEQNSSRCNEATKKKGKIRIRGRGAGSAGVARIPGGKRYIGTTTKIIRSGRKKRRKRDKTHDHFCQEHSLNGQGSRKRRSRKGLTRHPSLFTQGVPYREKNKKKIGGKDNGKKRIKKGATTFTSNLDWTP